MIEKLPTKGIIKYEHVRGGLIVEGVAFNSTTTEGKTYALSRYFDVNTENGPWYIGLIDNTGSPTLSAGDTMPSHTGWTEFTNYVTGTQIPNPLGGGYVPARPLWNQGTPSGGALTNATKVRFPITGSATVYGIFVTDGGARDGSLGTLWSTAAFSSPLTVAPGDLIRVIFAIQL
jgi:hypothetical protein